MEVLTESVLHAVITKRMATGYKGTFGRVVLIGGNEQYGGAIMMSAEAAVRSGAGLVTVVTASKNHSPLHARLPEAMVIDWQDGDSMQHAIKGADVLMIGSGLGLEPTSQRLLKATLALQQKQQWVIIDGSAITLFAQGTYSLNFPEKVVFTPHQMEWQRLSGIPIAQQTQETNQLCQQQLKATIVVKSHRTEIYTSTAAYQNPLGTPAMATGGMGDTLAGIIAGFLAQFPVKQQAICAAVYLHSLIGEELAATRYVVLPTEISQQLPRYMNHFASS